MYKKIFLGAFLGVLFLCLLLLAGGYFLLRQHEYRVPGEYFESDGVKIHYTREGEGVPVILVHGFAFNADFNWRRPGITDKLLEAGYQVIALDCRGHGLSEKPHEISAYGEKMPNDIARLMDHLKIDKAHVVGYSMGGFITLKFIDMHPERLLSAAPGGMAWAMPTEEDLATVEHVASALDERGDFTPLLQKIGLPIPENDLIAAFTRSLAQRANDTKALACVMRGFPEFAVSEENIKANKVPTLTIVGTKDPLAKGADHMHETMQNHELVYVEGGNHITTLRNAQFVEALLAFLDKHSTAENVGKPENVGTAAGLKNAA